MSARLWALAVGVVAGVLARVLPGTGRRRRGARGRTVVVAPWCPLRTRSPRSSWSPRRPVRAPVRSLRAEGEWERPVLSAPVVLDPDAFGVVRRYVLRHGERCSPGGAPETL